MNIAVFLVVEPIPIIATDLAMTLEEYDPHATVWVAHTQDEACRLLIGCDRVDVALVHADPATFLETHLGRMLFTAGTKVVFTGDKAECSASGHLVLHRPFSAQSLVAALQIALQSNAA
jgi:hypothetical protein